MTCVSEPTNNHAPAPSAGSRLVRADCGPQLDSGGGGSGGRASPHDETLLRSTLDALSAHIAVLDGQGTIIAVNRAWRDFAATGGYAGVNHGIGTNYLRICEAGAAASDDAARTARGLREIMDGQRTAFRLEYPCQTPSGQRWFQLRATSPADQGDPRIVVAHEDITDVKRAEEALARLTARLLRLQDEERRHIARELHDTTAQNLLAITLGAARLQDRRSAGGEGARRAEGEIMELAEQCLQEVRTLCYVLHPPLLDDVGLEAALRWLAKGLAERSGIAVETRIEEIGAALDQEAATAMFRVAQEALLNVHRHSGAAWARLALRNRGDGIELTVEDSGRGLQRGRSAADAEAGVDTSVTVGVGIQGMRVRIEQLGGRLTLRDRRPGLAVRAVLPVPPSRAGRQPVTG